MSQYGNLNVVKKMAGTMYGPNPSQHSNIVRGTDAGSRTTGAVSNPVGVPAKPRHRKYFAITPPNA